MKKSIRILLAWLCLMGFTLSGIGMAYADVVAVTDYDMTLYTSDSGIPTGEANAVLQSSDGYVWIGTYGGLMRYDGTAFEMISGTRGMTSFSIRSIWQGSDGTLWVGSNEQGPFYYDGKEFHQLESDFSGGHLSVRDFAEDPTGRIWIGTVSGLDYIEDKTIKSFDLEAKGYSNSTVYSVSTDGSGRIWLVDGRGNLLVVDPAQMAVVRAFIPGTDWREDVTAYSVCAASDGNVYVGTDTNCIMKLSRQGDDWACEEIGTDSVKSINDITETAGHQIWAGGAAGVGVLDEKGFHDCSYLENTSFISCIQGDYEGNIWAASSKYGVLHIRHGKISRVTQSEELYDKETYSICKYDGNYYVAYEGGVLVFSEELKKTEASLTNSMLGIQVHDIKPGPDGKIYLATYYNGVFIYDPKTDTLENVETKGFRCRSFLCLSDGRMAVGTNYGVEIISGGAVTEVIDLPAMVLCMVQDSDGSILCGTDGSGIQRVLNGKAEKYADAENGLSGGVILRIRKDDGAEGKFLVSCGTDMFYGNRDGFERTATLSQGSGSILDIFPDGDRIWLFRTSGILRCDRNELLSAGNVIDDATFLGDKDGMPGAIVANSWSLYDEGVFAICTVNGIGILDSDFSVNEVVPKCEITDIEFSDGTVWDGSSSIKLDKNLAKMTLTLSPLTYAGGTVEMQYWLEGLDVGPIRHSATEGHTAEYTSLDAGTYTFHFNVINSDGVWGNEKTLTFVKSPKFTETIWFPLLIFAVAGVLFYLISQYRVYVAKKKQAEYKQITDQTIATISSAIDAKDPYTEGHSRRVAEFSVKIGKKLGMSDEDLERLQYIALLHDIGKIGVPDNILKKPGRLDEEEFQTIKQHTVVGGEILKNFTVLPGVAEGAEYHHERYDGSGYVHHLKGEQIPLFARIISVADAYDAMNSTRCYRKALGKDIVVEELKKGSGHQFDPKLVDVALEILDEDGTGNEKEN